MMKLIISSIAALIALTLSAVASGSTWNIDPEHSTVGFSVRHLMISNIKGTFEKHSGTVVLNDKDITKSKVTVTIDTGSINTNARKRDEHLRGAEFFDSARYPTMTFVSKKVAKAGNGRLKITGNLTLHGVTRQIVLDVEGPTQERKDRWGTIRRGATATTTINRKDFGLVWNETMETGGVVVGEEVTITLEIGLVRK